MPTTAGSKSVPAALAFLVAGWGSAAAFGDEDRESITADEFLARVDLPEIDRLGADVLAAEAAVADAEALPDLGVSFEREEIFIDGEGVAQKNAISLEWSVDVSGRRGARVESAELLARATGETNAHKTHLMRMSALVLYYQAAKAKLRLASLRGARDPLARLIARLERRVGEGDASGLDLARFELELSGLDDRLAEAEADYAVAQKRVAGLLRLSGRAVEPSDALDLPVLPASPADASPGRRDLVATDHLADSGHALTRAAGRWWVPTFDLSIGYMTSDLGPGSGPGADIARGYSAMITASVPLFSRGRAERKRGEARLRRARATRELLERKIAVETQVARELLRSRVDRARRHADRQLVLVAALVKKTEAAYQGGEASSFELRDAYRQAVAAQLRDIDLRFESRMAELDVWRVAGSRERRGNQ